MVLAKKCLENILNLDQNVYQALFFLGKVYDSESNSKKAMECYFKAVEIKPDYYEALNNIGNLYLDRNENANAIKYFRKAIHYKQDYHIAWYNIAGQYVEKGNLTKAIQILKKTVHDSPDFGLANLALVQLYGMNKQYKDGIKHCKKATLFDPNNFMIWNTLGACYMGVGNLDDFLICVKKSIALNPKLPESHNNLSMLMFLKGNMKIAMKHLKMSKRISYGQDVSMNIGHYYLINNKLKMALKNYKYSYSLFKLKSNFWKAIRFDFDYI